VYIYPNAFRRDRPGCTLRTVIDVPHIYLYPGPEVPLAQLHPLQFALWTCFSFVGLPKKKKKKKKKFCLLPFFYMRF
jgi:hypothetical protein